MASSPARIESILSRSWLRRGALACSLWPLSMVFGAAVSSRRALYRAGLLRGERVDVPVIVVGNIFVGGTGKTPLVIWLVEMLREAGYRPGVVSRGYGRSGTGIVQVGPTSTAAEVGDEPLLIARRTGCQVTVGSQRAQAARALLAAHPEVNVIILDDGLQHYALERDIEIVLFDGRGVGNGWMLPAGPLREPASRSADFCVIHGSDLPPGLPASAARMRLVAGEAWRLADPADRRSLNALKAAHEKNAASHIAAAAGIGHPSRFFAMLRGLGIAAQEIPLPDHYDFSVNPFSDPPGNAADLILITEKDAVKCAQIESIRLDRRIWVVPVAASVDGALRERILEKLRGYPIA